MIPGGFMKRNSKRTLNLCLCVLLMAGIVALAAWKLSESFHLINTDGSIGFPIPTEQPTITAAPQTEEMSEEDQAACEKMKKDLDALFDTFEYDKSLSVAENASRLIRTINKLESYLNEQIRAKNIVSYEVNLPILTIHLNNSTYLYSLENDRFDIMSILETIQNTVDALNDAKELEIVIEEW